MLTATPIGMLVAFRDITDALQGAGGARGAERIVSLGLLAGRDRPRLQQYPAGDHGQRLDRARTMPPTGAAGLALSEAEKACLKARQLTWQLLTFSKGGVPLKQTIAVPQYLQ